MFCARCGATPPAPAASSAGAESGQGASAAAAATSPKAPSAASSTLRCRAGRARGQKTGQMGHVYCVCRSLCRRVFEKESSTATMAQHIGSCQGRGRANHAYHGYMVSRGGSLVVLSCPCCSIPVSCPLCQAKLECQGCKSLSCLLPDWGHVYWSHAACLLFHLEHVYCLK